MDEHNRLGKWTPRKAARLRSLLRRRETLDADERREAERLVEEWTEHRTHDRT